MMDIVKKTVGHEVAQRQLGRPVVGFIPVADDELRSLSSDLEDVGGYGYAGVLGKPWSLAGLFDARIAGNPKS